MEGLKLPLFRCRKCECSFQGEAGNHELELCNVCIFRLARDTAVMFTANGVPGPFPVGYEHHLEQAMREHEILLELLEVFERYFDNSTHILKGTSHA
jgi:hypothetical protein